MSKAKHLCSPCLSVLQSFAISVNITPFFLSSGQRPQSQFFTSYFLHTPYWIRQQILLVDTFKYTQISPHQCCYHHIYYLLLNWRPCVYLCSLTDSVLITPRGNLFRHNLTSLFRSLWWPQMSSTIWPHCLSTPPPPVPLTHLAPAAPASWLALDRAKHASVSGSFTLSLPHAWKPLPPWLLPRFLRVPAQTPPFQWGLLWLH